MDWKVLDIYKAHLIRNDKLSSFIAKNSIIIRLDFGENSRDKWIDYWLKQQEK